MNKEAQVQASSKPKKEKERTYYSKMIMRKQNREKYESSKTSITQEKRK
jgi:hypothetical protein